MVILLLNSFRLYFLIWLVTNFERKMLNDSQQSTIDRTVSTYVTEMNFIGWHRCQIFIYINIRSQTNGAETDIEKPQQTNKLVRRMSKKKKTQKDTITEKKPIHSFWGDSRINYGKSVTLSRCFFLSLVIIFMRCVFRCLHLFFHRLVFSCSHFCFLQQIVIYCSQAHTVEMQTDRYCVVCSMWFAVPQRLVFKWNETNRKFDENEQTRKEKKSNQTMSLFIDYLCQNEHDKTKPKMVKFSKNTQWSAKISAVKTKTDIYIHIR